MEGKKLQYEITGFLEKKAGEFATELWTLLVDAASQPSGIPYEFIKRKKEEIVKRETIDSKGNIVKLYYNLIN